MKCGLLADIHGNAAALRVALDMLRGCDVLICLGDMAGYYPEVDECCTLLREAKVVTIRGNHDAMLCGQLPCPAELRAACRLDAAVPPLQPPHRTWLAQLPVEVTMAAGGRRFCFRHASPWDETTYLGTGSEGRERLQLAENEVLCVGHTHEPARVRAGGGWLVNPGSTGLPRGERRWGAAAVLDTATAEVDFLDVRIDVREFRRRLTALAWPPELIARWSE